MCGGLWYGVGGGANPNSLFLVTPLVIRRRTEARREIAGEAGIGRRSEDFPTL